MSAHATLPPSADMEGPSLPTWRVQYLDPDEAFCVSVYRDEEIARMDTGRHLAALMGFLRSKNFFQNYRYGRDFPEMIADARVLAENVSVLLQLGEEWQAYDAWHEFLARWPEIFGLPIWIGAGTVIVEGPGPRIQVPPYPFGRGKPKGTALSGPAAPEPEPFEEGLNRLLRHPLFVRILKEVQDLRMKGEQARADELFNRHVQGALRRMAEDPEFVRVSSEAKLRSDAGDPAAAEAILDEYWGRFMERILPTGPRRLRRWKVTAGKPSEGLHASFHLHEEDARAQVERELREILDGARFIMEVFGRGAVHNLDYWREARDAAMEAKERLDSGDVWGGFDRWRQFEEFDEEAGREDGGHVGPPPMMPHVGTLRVEVD